MLFKRELQWAQRSQEAMGHCAMLYLCTTQIISCTPGVHFAYTHQAKPSELCAPPISAL